MRPASHESLGADLARFARPGFHPKMRKHKPRKELGMFAYDVWNSVYVEGPHAEIVRMRKLCCLPEIQIPTEEPVVDFSELMPHSSAGDQYWSYNLVTHGPHEPGTFSFGFDCNGDAPVEIFEALADEFQTLRFNVSCISSMDEFMASGSYNYPDNNDFKYEEVPADYWG